MCRFEIAVLTCATVLVGLAIAQDNVSTRTKALLAAEWKDTTFGGANRCLAALDKYTAHGADYDPSGALALLKAGISYIPGIDQAPLKDYAGTHPPYRGANGLYDQAHADGTMPYILAKATGKPTDKMNDKAKSNLFDDADKSIKETYGDKLADLENRVDKVYRSDPARALYQLLKDVWDPSKAAATAENMEVYRTCYLLDKSRLFGLVHAFLQDQ